jgi:hypothetical protein
VQRAEDTLRGYIHRGFTLEGGTLQESMGQITIGARLDSFDGSTNTYERNAEGVWEQASSGGGESWTRVGYALSNVTADAAWYDDALVTLSIECSLKVHEESACRNGPRRTCERCEAWGLFPTSSESFGMSRAPTVRKAVNRSPADCSASCPPVERPDDVKRAAEALRGHDFFTNAGMEPHPFVFRTQEACKAYRKIHPFSRGELEAWRANDPLKSIEHH